MPSAHPVLLFDGVCNLCNGFVQFIIRRDPEGVFRFASLQSDTGQQLMEQHGFDPEEINTVILIDQGKVYTKSDVALQVVRKFGGLWPLFSALEVLPKSIRDAIYDWVAKNRYRWFGKKDQCMIPTPELKARFL
jgi:predicted DCC family thiol-disulfide oxidoreductase YuxK